jgi:hypothetical protein
MSMPSRSVSQLLVLLVAASWPFVACDASPVGAARSDPSTGTDGSAAESADAGNMDSSVPQGRDGRHAAVASSALLGTFTVEREGGNGPSRLVLVTHGSSSCPWRVRDVQATGGRSVTITIAARQGTERHPCNLDDSKRRERFDLPSGVHAKDVATARLTSGGAAHVASVAMRVTDGSQ